MVRCIHRVLVPVATAALLLLSGCARHATRVRAFQQLPTLLTVADLIYQPAAYNRQVVTVYGWYRTGPHMAVLQPGFSYHGGTIIWVYDEDREDEPTGPPVRNFSKKDLPRYTHQEQRNFRALDAHWGQAVQVVMEGEFRCGTGFGHQSQYRCALFLGRVLAVGD